MAEVRALVAKQDQVAATQQASYERRKRIPVEGRLEDEETMRKQLFLFWKALLKIRSTQNGRRPAPSGAHRNWTSRRKARPDAETVPLLARWVVLPSTYHPAL